MFGDRVIRMSATVAADIRDAVRAAYPAEGCGVLLARPAASTADERVITHAVPVRNASCADARRRYRIPGDVVRAVERRAERHGSAVVGFYHSHPDRTAEPSPRDAALAWPWYTYLIVPVDDGAIGPFRAWRLRERRDGFDEERLLLANEGEDR